MTHVTEFETLESVGEDILTVRYEPEGTDPLPYHNLWHARDVSISATEIAAYAGLDGRTVKVLGLAGMFHDIEHREGPRIDEAISAETAARLMREDGRFNDIEEDIVVGGILSTIMRRDTRGRLRQSPREDVFTDRILADADLASLGKPWDAFSESGRKLFAELNPGAAVDTPDYYKFMKMQAVFVGQHRFYTSEARMLYPFQDGNLDLIDQWLADNEHLSGNS